MEKTNRYDAIIHYIYSEKTGIELLEMIREEMSRKAFVDRLL
jgi:hypothetical protein